MTLAEQMVSDVTDVFLNSDEHAQSVTRYPASGSSENITAIWEPGEPQVSYETGKKLVWEGKLLVSSSQTLLETDEWVINGETWKVDGTRGGIGIPHYGLVPVYVRITTKLRQKSQSESLK